MKNKRITTTQFWWSDSWFGCWETFDRQSVVLMPDFLDDIPDTLTSSETKKWIKIKIKIKQNPPKKIKSNQDDEFHHILAVLVYEVLFNFIFIFWLDIMNEVTLIIFRLETNQEKEKKERWLRRRRRVVLFLFVGNFTFFLLLFLA